MIKKTLLALTLLPALAYADSHLDTVLQTKELKICTTGDYKPYSYLRPDGQYQGLDVTMAESLAKSLGAKPVWVATTWKTLSNDFTAKHCDIAVGGISVTLKRQQSAWFAASLGSDGKIPLVRCADSQKYQTVEQLNRPQVRVIEPAGGTNEAFVHQYLPQANLTLFHDNVTIFHELLAHRADVMITDASEALYQKTLNPGLCALDPQQPLQYGEKAYMLPRDDISWKLYVDQWLHLSRATGEYQKAEQQWMGSSAL
ncbi:transporter substrate-binding domain-containing protein [Tatumella saanichensis]|uniref:transporter substrate-binding domain-containing protein n=1 Tax=Tatumella saanichensis TaxID=480813 RepID=UPI0004A3E532|nr:transporter substrate-binding domain-containing protein [Tatumella saanichensis]